MYSTAAGFHEKKKRNKCNVLLLSMYNKQSYKKIDQILMLVTWE